MGILFTLSSILRYSRQNDSMSVVSSNPENQTSSLQSRKIDYSSKDWLLKKGDEIIAGFDGYNDGWDLMYDRHDFMIDRRGDIIFFFDEQRTENDYKIWPVSYNLKTGEKKDLFLSSRSFSNGPAGLKVAGNGLFISFSSDPIYDGEKEPKPGQTFYMDLASGNEPEKILDTGGYLLSSNGRYIIKSGYYDGGYGYDNWGGSSYLFDPKTMESNKIADENIGMMVGEENKFLGIDKKGGVLTVSYSKEQPEYNFEEGKEIQPKKCLEMKVWSAPISSPEKKELEADVLETIDREWFSANTEINYSEKEDSLLISDADPQNPNKIYSISLQDHKVAEITMLEGWNSVEKRNEDVVSEIKSKLDLPEGFELVRRE